MSDSKQNKELFAQLVLSLAQSALIGLGKVLHPATGKAEVDLPGAQQAIDLIDMLESKTKGNIDAEEERMLKTTLSMLKLNYVETSNAPKSETRPPVAASEPAAPTDDANPAPDSDEKVKFRKTYG
ncbi:MAG: DUF1844 domain-containing protein [Kiritimatiellae bacterium]|nr:DUF1844 domain-containing protein [Kiritimatiellia bacterium]